MTDHAESGRIPIVLSSHPATGRGPALSELEFGLVIAGHAFKRWTEQCMAVAGAAADLSVTDAMVLLYLMHGTRARRLMDIGCFLNIEDIHVVKYAISKLCKHGLARADERAEEAAYMPTRKGRALGRRYRQVREQVLVSAVATQGTQAFELVEFGFGLRMLSTLYDQAARTATDM
ncbi:winged helix DNA-binding protein [Noviherbaspirillum galbum]|uniref:Winged helix DNA-binding protein n=1 Tax=Noviherbaspirillum galbum TaxID=2709383 RepID=A0A6B3SWP1_9BURK|nr:winged helix DNA-binding protein [Noviherbaspirillum galbum]NEX62139.1 winged helix DNA-binding protein [Noviherbaspirillum galbum]